MKLTFAHRMTLCWEILTARSGHAHTADEKQLPVFQRGYYAGMHDVELEAISVRESDKTPQHEKQETPVASVFCTHNWDDAQVTVKALRELRKRTDIGSRLDFMIINIPASRLVDVLRLAIVVKKSSSWRIPAPDNVFAAGENFLFACDDKSAVQKAMTIL